MHSQIREFSRWIADRCDNGSVFFEPADRGTMLRKPRIPKRESSGGCPLGVGEMVANVHGISDNCVAPKSAVGWVDDGASAAADK